MTSVSEDAIRQTMTALAVERGPSKSFCPSEVARALSRDWRPLMDDVRRVAGEHPDIVATQAGREVDPVGATGPIRFELRRPARGGDR